MVFSTSCTVSKVSCPVSSSTTSLVLCVTTLSPTTVSLSAVVTLPVSLSVSKREGKSAEEILRSVCVGT